MTRVRSAVFVTATEPEPRSFGKQVVIGGLLDHLRRRLGPDQVHVVLLGREDVARPTPPYRMTVIGKPSTTDQLRAVATRVLLPPHSSLQEAALWSATLRTRLGDLLAELGADLEVWDTMRVGQYARSLPRRRRVLYADDLFSKRYASMIRQLRTDPDALGNPLGEFAQVLPAAARGLVARPLVHRPLLEIERRLTHRAEDAAPRHFDATILVNPEETAELRSRTGDRSVETLLPLLPQPAERPRTFHGRPSFVFLGGLDFPPNRDGLTWFLTHCRDVVLQALPDFELLLVGRGSDHPPEAARAWGDHVRPLGWVPDLDSVLLSAAALLSPLRVGSGIKIKVLEALSRGLPVVGTEQGVLGMGVDAEAGCLVAWSPEELSQLLVEAADPTRNEVLSQAARNRWETVFAPSVVSAEYDRVLGLATPSEPQR